MMNNKGDKMNNNTIYDLYNVIKERKSNPQEGSYTCYLFDKGLDKILKKIGEECAETIIAAKEDDKEALVGEICDVIYHLMVMTVEKDIEFKDIFDELDIRAQKIGNLKQIKQVDKNS